jgi:hypothetical protein
MIAPDRVERGRNQRRGMMKLERVEPAEQRYELLVDCP